MVTKITNDVIDSGALTTGLAGANLSVSVLNAANVNAANIKLYSATITTLNANQNLTINPNGTGSIGLTGNVTATSNVDVTGNVNVTQALVASAQPSATVYFATNQSLTGATQYKLPIEGTNVSQGGMSVDTVNSRVTVPRAGRYLVTGVVSFYTTATQNADAIYLRFYKNNTSFIDTAHALFSPLFLAAANYGMAVPFTNIYSLAANDYIECYLTAAATTSVFTVTGAQWSIHLLS